MHVFILPDEFSETSLESAPDTETPPEESESVTVQSETIEEEALPGHPVGAVEGEHACNECGMVFQRRYALIMHALKHEKTRSFKCSVCSLNYNNKF